MRKKNKLHRILILGLVLICALTGCGKDKQGGTQSAQTPIEEIPLPETRPVETEPQDIALEMKYLRVEYPAELNGVLQHREEVDGAAVTEIFSLADQELYRISFGGGEGEQFGYLTVDGAMLPVTFTVSPAEIPEEDQAAYGAMMDLFNDILQTIAEDSRYAQSGQSLTYEEAKTLHWSVSLPNVITWEEVEEMGVYRVDYYGEVRGERIRLYTITLGETAPDNQLGTLKVNGENLPVGIISFGTQPGENWTEEEVDSLYVQLDTVNLVIQAIMENRNFSN